MKIWDTATGQTTITLQGGRGSVGFSPDGRRIVRGNTVWDGATGQESLTLRGHRNSVNSIALSADGRWIVSAGGQSRDALSFSASANSPGQAIVWDAVNGNKKIALRHDVSVWGADVSPDRKRVATITSDRRLLIWDADTDRKLHEIEVFTGHVFSVAFSPDGTKIYVGGGDRPPRGRGGAELRTVSVWDTATGKMINALRSKGTTSRLTVSSNGRQVALGVFSSFLLWSPSENQEPRRFRTLGRLVTAMAISPDGTRIITASGDSSRRNGFAQVSAVQIWDTATGKDVGELKEQTGLVSCVAFSPDGRWVVTGSGNQLKVWDVVTREEVRTLRGHVGRVTGVAFTPDGKRIISGSWDRTVKVWNFSPSASEMPKKTR